jgi:hypothetical protein
MQLSPFLLCADFCDSLSYTINGYADTTISTFDKIFRYPDYSAMLKKHRQTGSSLRGEPFPAALMGLYLGGHHPIRSKAAYSICWGLNETATFL